MKQLKQIFHTPRKHKNTRHFFTEEEDNILKTVMQTEKPQNWEDLAVHLPGVRPSQCRERWLNYLAPGIIRGNWTADEDEIIKKQVKEQGTKWTRIRKLLPGRTENDIKNRWNTTLKKL
jgi:myb proto-oncogene protein